jgi:hypothetical protein
MHSTWSIVLHLLLYSVGSICQKPPIGYSLVKGHGNNGNRLSGLVGIILGGGNVQPFYKYYGNPSHFNLILITLDVYGAKVHKYHLLHGGAIPLIERL